MCYASPKFHRQVCSLMPLPLSEFTWKFYRDAGNAIANGSKGSGLEASSGYAELRAFFDICENDEKNLAIKWAVSKEGLKACSNLETYTGQSKY